MVRINTLFGLLNWLFTPVKLYGGGGDGTGNSYGGSTNAANNAAATDATFGTSYSNNYSYNSASSTSLSSSKGGQSGVAQESVTESDFNTPIDQDFSSVYGGASMTSAESAGSVSSGANYADYDAGIMEAEVDQWAGHDASIDYETGAYSANVATESMLGFQEESIYGGHGYGQGVFNAEYSSNPFSTTTYSDINTYDNGSYISTEVSDNILGTTTNTTSVAPVQGGGWSVSEFKEGTFTDSAYGVSTTATGLIGKSYHSTHVGGAGFGYDTHYTTNNQKLGGFAEAGIDIAEMLMGEDVDQSTADTAFAVESIADIAMGLQDLPAMMSIVGMSGVPSAYRAVAAISSAMKMRSAYKGISGLANEYGLSGTKGVTNAKDNNSYTGGDSMTSYGNGDNSLTNSQSIGQIQGSDTKPVATSGGTPVQASTLSSIPQYANIAAISGHTGREDYSWNSMQTFRINYTGDKT